MNGRRISRRGLLAGAAAGFAFRDDTLRALARLDCARADPADEEFWADLRASFDVPADVTPFNHAGLSPSPRAVREAMALEAERANGNPSRIVFREQERELSDVRQRLAALLGLAADEVALTPNATHGLCTAILGLDLAPGDEVVASAHEYSRAFGALRQRERRDGIVVVEVPLEAPAAAPDAVAAAIVARFTARTRLVVLSQVTYLTGQILPVRTVAAAAALRGIPVLVDGAHGLGLLPESVPELGASFYTACLHKWLMGPVGTGVFAVRGPWIERLWPLHAADDGMRQRITKFEQWGTHARAPFLALREALHLHEHLGQPRIAARLALLRAQLCAAVAAPGLSCRSSADPDRAAAIVAVACAGVPANALADWLWREHRVHVTVADTDGLDAIRVSPHLFTTPAEVDRLAALLRHAAMHGV